MECWHWTSFGAVADFDEGVLKSVDHVESPLNSSVERPFPFFCLVGQYQLADSDALAGALGVPRSADHSDSSLILHSYAKWGERTPEHLDGQFSFAIWDTQKGQLFCCRDHLGSLPFVYAELGSRLAIAGDMQTFTEHFDVPRRLNSTVLASYRQIKRLALAPGDTFFEGVRSLPPGHSMVARKGGVRLRQYWQPSIRPELVPKREDDVYEQTRVLVERAIVGRIARRKSVGLMLSGGLDSSVVAAVVAHALKKTNRSFVAFGAVNEREPSAASSDERSFMDQLSGLDNMQLEHVAATGRGPFDGIEDPVGFRTSCNRYSRHFMDCSIHEAAGSRGVDVLLSGIFGEYTISAKPGPYLLEFASQMRFATLLRELRCQSEMLNHSRVRRFAAQAWHHMIPGSPGPDTVFLRSEFVRQFAPKSLGRSPLWPSTQRTELKRVNDLLNIDAFSSTVPRNVAFATAIPFRDRRLLEFCLALPAEYKVRNGFSRYLLRRSFESVLPRSIAWRTTKMPYSPDYASRYNSQINKAREFVNSISRSDPVADLVDIERLRRATNPVGSDRNSSMVALLPVPRSIYLINFLRHFPAFRV